MDWARVEDKLVEARELVLAVLADTEDWEDRVLGVVLDDLNNSLNLVALARDGDAEGLVDAGVDLGDEKA